MKKKSIPINSFVKKEASFKREVRQTNLKGHHPKDLT